MDARTGFLAFFALVAPLEWALASAEISTEAALNFDAVSTLVQDGGVSSVDDLLDRMPPDFKKGYSLVYSGRSTLQAATPSNPRAVVYGQTGKFVMTFNGNRHMKGGNSVEIMQYNDKSNQFEFYEITFPKKKRKPAEISKANPSRCTSCHGDPAHPIWDNYPLWPGVYGLTGTIKGGSKEDRDFRALAAQVRAHPDSRYAKLGAFGYVMPNTHVSRIPKGESYTLQNPQTGNSGNQGSDLSKLLLWYNYKRILASLKASPKYPKIRFGLQYRFLGCSDPITTAMPAPLAEEMKSHGKSLEAIEAQTAQAVTEHLDKKMKRVRALDPKGDAQGYADPGQWRLESAYLIEARMLLQSQGMDIDDWTMTKESGTYTLGTDQGLAEMMGYLATLDNETELPGFSAKCAIKRPGLEFGGAEVGGNMYIPSDRAAECCEILKKKSIEALSAPANGYSDCPPDAESTRPLGGNPAGTIDQGMSNGLTLLKPPAALASCVSCHDGSNPSAPKMPFDKPGALKALLKTGMLAKIRERLRTSDDKKRMPQGRGLDESAIRQLEEYFGALSGGR